MVHPLLQPDLVACIIDHIDSQSTLARLAQTSKDISDIALNQLWRSVSVLALAKCMPQEYWEDTETFIPDLSHQWTAHSIPSLEDRYTRRLVIDQPHPCEIHTLILIC
jgi:hypothetical protein